jgi:HEPN domain-containing protein
MPRKLPITPGSPQEWLLRAKSNLALAAQTRPEGALWEDQCFLAQQAAEKALKAVYQHRGLMFEFIHDLKKLGKGLERDGLRVPSEVREVIALTKYAFETRYPGPFEPVTEAEYKQALVLAEAVVDWADKIISAPDKPSGGLGVQESHAVYKVGKYKAKSKRR